MLLPFLLSGDAMTPFFLSQILAGLSFGLDVLAELPKAKALLEQLHAMPNAQKVAADREAAMPAFMAMIAAKK